MDKTQVDISGISVCVPSHVEDNLAYPHLEKSQREKLVKTTGIRFRRIAKTQTTLDLGLRASEHVLENIGWESQEIDFLILVTQSPKEILPGSASQLHQRLNLKSNALAIDINQGCAGYVYGLFLAQSLLIANSYQKGLLVVGDTINQYIPEQNTSLRPIFSDAVSATTIESKPNINPWRFSFEAFGDRYNSITVPQASHAELTMNGYDVLSFGLNEVSKGVRAFIDLHELDKEVDYLVMHQANKLLNDSISKKLSLSKAKRLQSIYEYGNTSSATIPLTLCNNLSNNSFPQPSNFLLIGFGVGMTYGVVHLTLANTTINPIIELS